MIVCTFRNNFGHPMIIFNEIYTIKQKRKARETLKIIKLPLLEIIWGPINIQIILRPINFLNKNTMLHSKAKPNQTKPNQPTNQEAGFRPKLNKNKSEFKLICFIIFFISHHVFLFFFFFFF